MAITPDGRTLYVTTGSHSVTPISTATNKAGKPIHLTGEPVGIAITPDGKTAYVASDPSNEQRGTVTPVSTATNQAGDPIRFGSECHMGALRGHLSPAITDYLAITPDGKTVYLACLGGVVPISTATNTPGQLIHLPLTVPWTIAITP